MNTPLPLKILLYDTENIYNVIAAWGVWEQNAIRVIEHRQIISFAWKWLGEKKVHCLALPDFPEYKKNPKNNYFLMKKLHELLCEADVSIAHNGISFDDRRSNTDMIKHGFTPPPNRRSIDTLRVARTKFGFNSNKLDDLGEFLKVGRKVKHPGISMWDGCRDGDMKSWAMMKKYNAGDIYPLLEKVYLKLRPWMTNHPNMNPLPPTTVTTAASRIAYLCPACRSPKVHQRGFYVGNLGKSPKFQCQDCGKWSKGQIVKRTLRLT